MNYYGRMTVGPMILRSDIREASQSPWLQKELDTL